MFKKNLNQLKKLRDLKIFSAGRAGFIAAIFLCLGALLLAGCQTVPTLSPMNLAEPGWTVSQGQAVWRQDKKSPEIAGEILLATNIDGRTFVEFTKTPLPLLIAETTAHSWQIHSVPDNKTYSGRGNPPIRAIWLYLPRCLTGATPPKPLTWRRTENEGWHLENSRTGEFVEGYLSP
jgi:hypothetical protein